MYLLVNDECVSALDDFLRSNELSAADETRVRSLVPGERIVIGQCDTVECVALDCRDCGEPTDETRLCADCAERRELDADVYVREVRSGVGS